MELSAEGLYLARTAYEAYHDSFCPLDFLPYDDLNEEDKRAWEASADAVRHLVMRALTRRIH